MSLVLSFYLKQIHLEMNQHLEDPFELLQGTVVFSSRSMSARCSESSGANHR